MDADAARAQRRVGDKIAGKYQLTRLLGSGGMGAVYEAVHEFTRRTVAVKLMHPSFARSGVAAERFLREAQAPGSIGHPGIVEVLDGGRDADGSLYLVLELLEGCTLADELKRGPLPERRVASIALELLDALGAAHEAGFVHRDLKPENVFLQEAEHGEPIVKLLDFGVAGVLASPSEGSGRNLTVAGSVLGTPLYMSPEQAMGRRVDERSDLWSLGAVMYQALAGRPPFGGDSFQALIVSISTDHHLPLTVVRPSLPARLAAVIERALDKDVARRWQSAAEMAAALREATQHAERVKREAQVGPVPPRAAVTAAAATPAPAPSASLPADGGLPLWPLGLVLMLVALAFAGFQIWGPRSGEEPAATGRPAIAEPRAKNQEPTGPGEPASPSLAGGASDRPSSTVASASEAAKVQAPEAAGEPAADAAPRAAQRKSLGAGELGKVMREHEGELQRCYQDEVVNVLLASAGPGEPKIAPLRLDVSLEVAPAGDVREVVLEGAAGDGMKHCARTALRKWRFPASDTITEASFPVVFQPTIVR